MNADTCVVFDESELAKATHESVHARSRAPDHIRQRLLRDRLNQRALLPGWAILRQKQQDSRQPFFGSIKELIHQVGLGFQTAREQKRRKQIRKGLLLPHDTKKLRSQYP